MIGKILSQISSDLIEFFLCWCVACVLFSAPFREEIYLSNYFYVLTLSEIWNYSEVNLNIPCFLRNVCISPLLSQTFNVMF